MATAKTVAQTGSRVITIAAREACSWDWAQVCISMVTAPTTTAM